MSVLKVLIIDDDPVDRTIFKEYLHASQPGGFDFAEEDTGRKGLARLDSFQPDCLLLDFNLPDIDGLTMIRHLTRGAEFLPCPVVMLTAIGSEQIAVEAMKLGVMDYLVKGPASSEALARTVASAVQRFRLQQEVAGQRVALQQRNAELEAIRAELFEEKERYRILAEAIPQLVWTADSDGHIYYANRRLREFSGREEFWNVSEIIHPADSAGVLESWREAGAAHRTFECELRLLRARDESYRWHLLRAVAMPGAVEGHVRWFGTFTDLEDQKRAEEALRQRQKLDSIGVLAGGIAHDFNNLLVGIMGGASFALDLLDGDHPARSMLEIVVRSSERAAQLTQQLLAYAGKGKTMLQPVDIPRIVRDTCELVRASVPKTVQVVLVTEPGIPILETNAAHMQQLVMNLVINAAEAIGEQPGTVTVRTSLALIGAEPVPNVLGYALAPGEYLRIEVEDTGEGMDEKTQAQIFDPFFTTKFTGRGLGLAAVHGIVRSLNGAIHLSSSPGKGSRFNLLFPLRRASEPGPLEPGRKFSPHALVLVIDDEEIVRTTAASALQRAGHEVILAHGGRTGLELFEANQTRISLVLLDMSMPEMSGNETLMHLRRKSKDIPVAVMSGYSEDEIAGKFDGLNVSDYIQKPFTSGALAARVNVLLRPEAARRQIAGNAAVIR
jgi:PAS domain S-box-containing protein